jgi:hypothetical protein
MYDCRRELVSSGVMADYADANPPYELAVRRLP